MRAGGFQQDERADDVRVDETLRAVDRAIDVRLGREIHDRNGLMLAEDAADRVTVRNVCADERDSRILQNVVEVQQAAGVRQLVDNDDAIGAVRECVVDEVRADEAGSAGDQN